MLIPVKRFARGQAPAGRASSTARSAPRWPAGWPTASSPPPAAARRSSPATTTRSRRWADGAGAEVLWSPGLGLNGAVDAGRATIAGKGFDHLVIAHSDLPLATDLRLPSPPPDTICLVPDRRRDGTNVLALPVDAAVPASYGGGSFSRHLELAMASGPARRGARRPAARHRRRQPGRPAPPRRRAASCRRGCERSWPTLADGGRRVGAHDRDRPVPASALAIGAHPDDVEFGAGGTLAKWAAGRMRRPPPRLHRRLEGHVGPVGRPRRAGRPPPRSSSARRPAAWPATGPARSASSIASTATWRAIGRRRARSARIIRELRPEVVLGHDPWKRYRLHPDHRHAGWLVCDAIVAARDPHFFPEHGLPHHRPTALLLCEADAARPRRGRHRVRRPQARRAGGPREPVRVDDARRRRRRARGVPPADPRPAGRARRAARPRRGRGRSPSSTPDREEERIGVRIDVDPFSLANWPGRRPSPGGPAKAWAMSIHSSAAGPSTSSSTSSRWRRCVTTRQKSSAGPRDRSARRPGPTLHESPDGATSSTRTGVSSGVSSVGDVAEPPGADADVGHVAQAIGRSPLDPECVGDVLTVGPRLHQPSGDERAGAHRRAVPRHPALGVDRPGLRRRAAGDRSATRRAARHQRGCGRPATDGSGPSTTAREQELGVRGEAVGVGQRQQRPLVEEPEVAQSGRRRSSRRRRRHRQVGTGDERVEVIVFGGQVVAQRVHRRIIADAGHAGIGRVSGWWS